MIQQELINSVKGKVANTPLYKQWFPNLTEEQLDEKIIHSAINFWFEDEDAGSGKAWNYFKDI